MFNEGLTGSRGGEFNTLEFNETPTAGLDLYLSDTGDGSETLAVEWGRSLSSTLQATAMAIGSGTFTATLEDSGSGTDGVVFVLNLLLSDSGNSTASLGAEHIFALIDAAAGSGAVQSRLDAIAAVAVAAAIFDAAVNAYDQTLVSEAEAASAIASVVQKIATLAATAEATAAVTNTATLFTTLVDTGEVTDAISSSASLFAALESGAVISGVINLDGEQYSVYTVNATTGGVTEYRDFPFNSFAYLTERDVLLAAGAGGIYRITGADDDGAPIAARIKTGQLDFGAPSSKRVEFAGLGYTSSGKLVLKVIVVNDGRKREHWYQLTSTAGAAREGRIRLGLGMQSRYWQFELTSNDDFEITDMELYPLLLSRRGGV